MSPLQFLVYLDNRSQHGYGNEVDAAAQILPIIVSLKRSATHFVKTLENRSSDCPVLHVHGASTIFSCYSVNGHLLSFYSKMQAPQSFDIGSADKAMIPTLEKSSQDYCLWSVLEDYVIRIAR